ncbi:EGFR-like transmembrane domain-containing protein [Paenibacillus piscarius]|uniref:EGFR-like transmembrane domain-containing protein n=1 Tax=Paenibacillus piscarius TaxID=1089681 RepID=UPI001EE9673B|nr:transmembrane domain-containing protein [Paenibacillus piscarius]
MKKRRLNGTRIKTILIMLMLVLLLAGCAQGTAHMTVKKDGSLDLAFSLLLDARAEKLVSGAVEKQLSDRLAAAGIELKKTASGKSTEYQFKKSYASIEELKNSSSGIDVVDAEVSQTDRWLYTKYNISAQPKLNAYSDEIIDGLGSLNVPKSLVRLLMGSFSVDFKLTIPYDLYGENNAAEQDGNTLTWHVSLADSEPIQLSVYVPDIRNIAIAGGGLLLIIAMLITYFIRRRKQSRSKPKAPPEGPAFNPPPGQL